MALLFRRDQNSSLEREFRELLQQTDRRLLTALNIALRRKFREADFYYERDGLPGVCVFCDGPDHDQPMRKKSATSEGGVVLQTWAIEL